VAAGRESRAGRARDLSSRARSARWASTRCERCALALGRGRRQSLLCPAPGESPKMAKLLGEKYLDDSISQARLSVGRRNRGGRWPMRPQPASARDSYGKSSDARSRAVAHAPSMPSRGPRRDRRRALRPQGAERAEDNADECAWADDGKRCFCRTRPAADPGRISTGASS